MICRDVVVSSGCFLTPRDDYLQPKSPTVSEPDVMDVRKTFRRLAANDLTKQEESTFDQDSTRKVHPKIGEKS